MTILSLVVIRSSKVEAALAFYSALGMTWQPEQHGSGPIHHSCTLGETTMEVYPLKANTEQLDTATMIGFKVDSLDHTLAILARLGLIPKSSPKTSNWGRWVNIVDPDGRIVQLSE
ncbi:MAG TPA: VOC family protein [Abditibacteriaceae bacterium]|jgi:predicted enzyme related to lactoylglutathione lyase|nr:VOC family protein [Abditibacteriaceae bacterium]